MVEGENARRTFATGTMSGGSYSLSGGFWVDFLEIKLACHLLHGERTGATISKIPEAEGKGRPYVLLDLYREQFALYPH